MYILVVCKDLHQADVLYFQYVRCFGIATTARERLNRELTVPIANTVRFISEAQLEIAQRGRRNVKIVTAYDVQQHILKTLRQGGHHA